MSTQYLHSRHHRPLPFPFPCLVTTRRPPHMHPCVVMSAAGGQRVMDEAEKYRAFYKNLVGCNAPCTSSPRFCFFSGVSLCFARHRRPIAPLSSPAQLSHPTSRLTLTLTPNSSCPSPRALCSRKARKTLKIRLLCPNPKQPKVRVCMAALHNTMDVNSCACPHPSLSSSSCSNLHSHLVRCGMSRPSPPSCVYPCR